MKKKEFYELHAEFCKTFTNPKRIEILDLLRTGEMRVTAIQEKIGESKSHTSLMLSVMRMKGVLKAKRDGANIYYSIADDKIAHACVVMQEALAGMIGKAPRARTIREGR
ncbi:MAG: metalloregulator ArsR/SmtB family transcription factor [Nitrospirota bacterium]